MKITIHQDPDVNETEISITCSEMTSELQEIIANICLFENTFAGKKDGATFFIPMKDIYYFESVDGTTFIYTEDETYEAAARLYKIEETLHNSKFARISKSVIANLSKMQSITPEKNSRLIARLTNGENILVSRQYVSEIKKKLGV